jgi:hypothetical protein
MLVLKEHLKIVMIVTKKIKDKVLIKKKKIFIKLQRKMMV